MLDLDKEESCCLLTDLMDEAEDAWKSVMKRQTIAALAQKMQEERFQKKTTGLEQWIREKMVA